MSSLLVKRAALSTLYALLKVQSLITAAVQHRCVFSTEDQEDSVSNFKDWKFGAINNKCNMSDQILE